jgi:hypothetical protein
MWRTVILPELFRPDEFSILYFIFRKGFFLNLLYLIEVNVVVGVIGFDFKFHVCG